MSLRSTPPPDPLPIAMERGSQIAGLGGFADVSRGHAIGAYVMSPLSLGKVFLHCVGGRFRGGFALRRKS